MIRLLGAITGSALALATLLVVIGVPQFRFDSSDEERAVVTLPLPTSPVDSPTADTETETTASMTAPPSSPSVDAPPEAPVEQGESAAVAHAQPSSRVVAAETTVAPPQPEPRATQAATVAAADMVSPDVIDDAQSWYAFWSPFRSELAANGFVEQLQSVTGLDYRVVRIKPGVYEVAFAYQDDNDITANLTQITAATGLDLPQ